MKKKIAAWIALGLITLVAGLMLALTNEVTSEKIKTQEIEAKEQARRDVLPAAETFEAVEMEDLTPLSELFAGKKGDEVVGYVGMMNANGYGGPVQVIAGIDSEGKVTGISVGGRDFSETAGLGAKSKEPAFMQQFAGKATPIRVVKSAADRGDNTIDAITAATITSNAVTGAVNKVADKVNAYLNPDDGKPAEGTTYTAEAQGFGGPVAVFVTVKDDGTISGLVIGDDRFAETEGFGMGAKEPTFTNQFIGKTLPITLGDIDAVSGATITTTAVVDALNKAIEEKNVVAPAAPEGVRYTASEQGFGGPVAVFVTVKDDGTITGLEIGDDQFNETEGFGMGAKEPGFINQFIGKTVPVALDNIDAVSGATITTTAVVNAINRAYEEKLVDESAAQPVEASAVQEKPSEEPQTEQTAVVIPEGARTESASSKGFGGPVGVTIWLNDDDTIAAIQVGDDDFAETDGIGSRAREEEYTKTFIGKKVPLAEGDVDTLSGATVTSAAVIKAVNKAAEKLGITAEAAPAAEVVTEAPVEETAAPAEGKTATSSSKGFDGPVAVTITLNDDNTIASLVVGDDDFAETDGIGSRAREEEYTKTFIGKKVPLAEGDVDTLSGATVTSAAVIKAINKAAEKLGITAEAVPAAEAAPAAEVTESPVEETAAPAEGKTATSSSKGFGGPVAVTITLNDDNTIASLVVGDDDFAETDGIGSRAREEEYTKTFIGKKVPLAEGDVDTLSGATVTSAAVIKAINKAAEKLGITAEAVPAAEVTEAPVEETVAPVEGRTATSSSKGFGGPVAVTITLNGDNTIVSLVVGDEDFAETDGIGSRAREEEYTKTFIGKKVPLAEGDVDTLSGATVTSAAVIKAVNKAAEKLGITAEAVPAAEAAPAAEATEAPAEETAAPVEGRTATSSSKGFGGPVAVTIMLNDDNTIASLVVGDEDFAETDGIGSRAREEEYTKTFIGKKVPLAEGDVDTLSGATVTSAAVVKAVNKAAEKLGITAEATPAAEVTEAPAEETAAPVEGRTATSSSKGFGGPVAVTIMLNDDNTIASLVVGDDDFAETNGIGSRAREEEYAKTFIGKKVPLAEGDVDTLSGATVTSAAVIKAVNKAAEQLLVPAQGKELTASAQGFGGPITVSVTLNADNTIASLTISKDSFEETVGIGSKVLDEAFVAQFIGKTVPLKDGDIDTIANATVSSAAVIKAVNEAAAGLMK